MLLAYCKAKAINTAEIMKPEYMEGIMRKYGFKEWDAVLAALGHGGLKEGQIINKMKELYERDHRRVMSNEEILASIAENNSNRIRFDGKKRGIMVNGIDDVAVRFSKCCSPLPGDEIVGFVTRGRGVSIHRTDCINVINLPEIDRIRLIDADWQQGAEQPADDKYVGEITIYANNRNGLLADISKALTEKNINIISLNTRINRQGVVTMDTSFEITNKEELNRIIERVRNIESVIDIERTTG